VQNGTVYEDPTPWLDQGVCGQERWGCAGSLGRSTACSGLAVHSAGVWGVVQGGEDAATPSPCPPAPLTTQKPGPAVTDVPWFPAKGLLTPGFSTPVALQQGPPRPASPRQGTREPGTPRSDAPGSASSTPKASHLLNRARLALLACTSWSHLSISLRLARGKPCLGRWGRMRRRDSSCRIAFL